MKNLCLVMGRSMRCAGFIAIAGVFGASCTSVQTESRCPAPPELGSVSPPAAVTCSNDRLTNYDSLLVLAPHPDDEALGFAGLRSAYAALGKRVEVVIVTDGDAYCDACQLWKNRGLTGETCTAADLRNFATPEIDSFAEIRRDESRASAAILGTDEPEFLGYPDTGLARAWAWQSEKNFEAPLPRSDFSMCTECGSCGQGYGGGPLSELTTNTLLASLRERLAATSDRTLVATTHPLDGHGDHAALGEFVRQVNSELESPRPLAFAVIHAHTPGEATHADCWFPGPATDHCGCAAESCADEEVIAARRQFRYRPEWPSALPDDVDYGAATHLCLPSELTSGDDAKKLRAIEAYPSQLGFLGRGGPMPPSVAGIMDCSGYLISFVRQTETFVISEGAD